MANTKELVASVLDAAKVNLKNISHLSSENVGTLFGSTSVSHESAEYGQLKSTVSDYENAVNAILASLTVSGENFDAAKSLKKSQINAGRMIAALASNPKAAIAEYGKSRQVIANDEYTKVVSPEAMNVEGYLSNEEAVARIAQEAFDGQNLNNAIYFSIAYNIGAATQDEFGETIYPTIAVSPTESGISLSVEYVAVMKEFLRSVNGTVQAEVVDRTSIIKSRFDNKVFGPDNTALVPVLRDSNKDKFVDAGKYVEEKLTGTAITTAPLKFSTPIDLLGISMTDDLLAKGVMDNTDAIDRAVSLSRLYFTIPETKGSATTELFMYDVSIANTKRFYVPQQGHWKQLVCNFSMKGASINTSNTKQADGKASTRLQAIGANYNIIIQLDVTGGINVEDGRIDLNPSPIRFIGVRDQDGNLVADTESVYTDAKEAIEEAKLVGYVVDAKRTNTNVRTRGVVVSNEVYNYIYNAPFRSGITCLKPLVQYSGVENDANRVAAQAQATGFIISNMAVSTITDHVSALRAASVNGSLGTLKLEGPSEKFIDAYFREENVDLADVVDSLESNKRDDDVRANILQRVNNIAMDMIIKSKYGPAFEVLKGNSGQKITIVIATDPNIARLIVRNGVSEFEYGDRFKFKVVSTFNELMTGTIYVLPTVLDENKNTTPDPLNYGFCIYTPTIVYEVSKTTNGAVAGELNTIPRFLHVTNLPVAGVINVSDVSGVFDKLELYTAPRAAGRA